LIWIKGKGKVVPVLN